MSYVLYLEVRCCFEGGWRLSDTGCWIMECRYLIGGICKRAVQMESSPETSIEHRASSIQHPATSNQHPEPSILTPISQYRIPLTSSDHSV